MAQTDTLTLAGAATVTAGVAQLRPSIGLGIGLGGVIGGGLVVTGDLLRRAFLVDGPVFRNYGRDSPFVLGATSSAGAVVGLLASGVVSAAREVGVREALQTLVSDPAIILAQSTRQNARVRQ